MRLVSLGVPFRVALSAITTLVADHVLKVQSFEYRVRCMEMLVDRALRLRRSAAVATKLCLAALSDGHTIDVFWVRVLLFMQTRSPCWKSVVFCIGIV